MTDLRVAEAITSTDTLTATLRWTASADAVPATLRYSHTLITEANWAIASLLTDTLPGSTDTFTATVPYGGGTVYFALKWQNAEGNWADLSNNGFWPYWDVFLPLVTKGRQMECTNRESKGVAVIMKTQRFFGLVLVLVPLMVLSGAIVSSASTTCPDSGLSPSTTYTHKVPAPDIEVSEVPATAMAQASGPIIIDHTCTDLSKIPDYWIEKAKELTFHYAHTSHGGQIRSGIEKLEQVNPKYNIRITNAGSTPPTSLPGGPGELRIYDGNPPETYITPEDYWSTAGGVSRTRAVADTGLFGFSMWSWCGQQSSNSEATVQQYLDTLHALEQDYLSMRFIYMTGHTDGGSATLTRNNNMVRDYVRDHGKVLFDFADIETYDPDGGGPYTNNSEGNCTWCVTWCNNHPEDCSDLPSSCAHSDDHPEDKLFCKLKGQAFWWMMARLAGWDGTPEESASQKSASVVAPEYGQTITYTIVVQDLTAPLTATVHLTDVVPTGLSYLPGTLTATTGTVTDTAAPTLRWSGVLTPSSAVTVTYAVTVSVTEPQAIFNTVDIAAPGYQSLTRTATIIANGYPIYVPLVLKKNIP